MISAWWLLPAFVCGAGCGFIGLGIFATGARQPQITEKVLPFPRRVA